MGYCEVSVFLQRRIQRVKLDLDSARINYRYTGLGRYANSLKAAQNAFDEAEHHLEEHLKHCPDCHSSTHFTAGTLAKAAEN
jgi:hypothetical protein